MLELSTLKKTIVSDKAWPYWLALWRAPTIGPRRFFHLLQRYPELEHLFKLSRSQLERSHFPEPLCAYLAKPDWAGVEADLKWREGCNTSIVSFFDPNYPRLLKESPSPPPLLFVHGDLVCLNSLQFAMVGSRKPTSSGKEIAFDFATQFAQAGLTVCSGLAVGIDAASHAGALNAQAKTIAVLGTGIDKIYPRQHKALAREIIEQGALVTEFPVGVSPAAKHFPRRNRIIAGLSLGTLVVEAALKSGSLITARQALDAGREVFAVPGSIRNPQSCGCHYLIQQGAKLVTCLQHVLEEFAGFRPITVDKIEKNTQIIGETDVLEHIGYEITPIDVLITRTGLSFEAIMTKLLDLELCQCIEAVPGGYVRIK